ncbi:MAG: ribonuclease H-like domain-containing protein [Pseudomonadota bacterium]
MLKNTFCHINGIGEKTEKRIWDRGILSWMDALDNEKGTLAGRNLQILKSGVRESQVQLDSKNAKFFADALNSSEVWRIFPHFRDSVAYLDIESNGLAGSEEIITTISVFNGSSLKYYIRDYNLYQFKEDIAAYKLLVTYNGKCFDLPAIERHLGVKFDQAHIDLRFVLASLGYKGGLKGCEKLMGIDRGELTDVDGYFAVLLWREYCNKTDIRALETLLAYNVLDAVNLEYLMVKAYNEKILDTPFARDHQMPLPSPVENPFEPDPETIDRLRRRYFHRNGIGLTNT